MLSPILTTHNVFYYCYTYIHGNSQRPHDDLNNHYRIISTFMPTTLQTFIYEYCLLVFTFMPILCAFPT